MSRESVREGLKPTSHTVNPYKKTIRHGEEGQRTTSLSREGDNTTSPIVIQKGYVLKEVMKHNSEENFNITGKSTNIMFYEDYINVLKSYGVNTLNLAIAGPCTLFTYEIL